jgi:hypothetical protein
MLTDDSAAEQSAVGRAFTGVYEGEVSINEATKGIWQLGVQQFHKDTGIEVPPVAEHQEDISKGWGGQLPEGVILKLCL